MPIVSAVASMTARGGIDTPEAERANRVLDAMSAALSKAFAAGISDPVELRRVQIEAAQRAQREE